MAKRFDWRLFIILVFAFIGATIIGTLSHECGHYLMAKSFGYSSRISFASAYWNDPQKFEVLDTIYSQYSKEIVEGSTFPRKAEFEQLSRTYSNDSLWITAGGPLQTLLTGTIGLILLLVGKRSFQSRQQLTFRQWTLVLITLFWLRQAAGLFLLVCWYVFTRQFFSKGDEIKIAVHLGLPSWSLIAVTGMIGFGVLYLVVFKFIPRQQRLTFILAGMTGGIAGYILWLHWLGPVLLP
ncbi:MAG TPA: hypothetical protein VFI06_06035 [Chitinophagaceae bacterium]|nr:hypothetical protein [Chitinophagaceae bacterium]